MEIHPRIPIMALLMAIFLTPVAGEDTIPPTTSPQAAHYEYLSQETTRFREFIEKERTEHRVYLQWFYGIAGTAIAAILVFFGIQNRKDLKEALASYRERAESKLEAELLKIDSEFQGILKKERAALVDLARQASSLKTGRFLFLLPENEGNEELSFFEKAINKPHVDVPGTALDLHAFDVIIYYYQPKDTGLTDEKGKKILGDKTLEELVGKVPEATPLIVYTHGEWVMGETDKKLKQHALHVLANNTITLIDNTASAYKVAKLMQV